MLDITWPPGFTHAVGQGKGRGNSLSQTKHGEKWEFKHGILFRGVNITKRTCATK